MTIDLGHHGDTEVGAGLIDLAVNVRRQPMPAWLAEPLAASLSRLAAYPDATEATAAAAFSESSSVRAADLASFAADSCASFETT